MSSALHFSEMPSSEWAASFLAELSTLHTLSSESPICPIALARLVLERKSALPTRKLRTPARRLQRHQQVRQEEPIDNNLSASRYFNGLLVPAVVPVELKITEIPFHKVPLSGPCIKPRRRRHSH